MLYYRGMKTILSVAILALFIGVFSPSVTHAQGLTTTQVSAIVEMLKAFGVDKDTIKEVRAMLQEEKKEARVILKKAPVEEPVDEGCTVTHIRNTSYTTSC